MSEVTKLAEAEAARAEAEPDPDDDEANDDDDQQQPEPEPQAEPAPNGEPSEEQMKAFRSEDTRHEKALRKIMGADFEMLAVCDHCSGMGYAPRDQLRTHKKYIGCETCNAFGVVLTGSKAPGNETQPCPVCAGRGFLEELPAAPAGQPTANGETQQQPNYGTPSWMGNPEVTPRPYAAPPVS